MRGKMFWVLAAVSALFVFTPALGIAQAQASEGAQDSISMNCLGTLITAIADSTSGLVSVPFLVDYQQVLTDHYSLSFIPFFEFLIASTVHDSIVNSSLDSFEFQPWVEVDWHPFDKGLNGFFIGLAGVGSLDVKLSGNQDTTIFLGVAPVIGYKLLLPWSFDLDFALGIALGGSIVVDSAGNASIGFAANHSRIEIALGYMF